MFFFLIFTKGQIDDGSDRKMGINHRAMYRKFAHILMYVWCSNEREETRHTGPLGYLLILPLLLCNQFWKSPIKIQEKVSSCLV
jgi:hypothetical protein